MELGKLQDAQSVKEIKAEIASLKGLLLSRFVKKWIYSQQ